MAQPEPKTKSERIARVLEAEIRSGFLHDGAALSSETALVARFAVSRATVRKGLGVLAAKGLIRTKVGIGSFVTYGGAVIDNGPGWSLALSEGETRMGVRILSITRQPMDLDAPQVAAAEVLAVDRLRFRENTGRALTLERSRVPWREDFAALLRTGLEQGSLSRELELRGLSPAWGGGADAAPAPPDPHRFGAGGGICGKPARPRAFWTAHGVLSMDDAAFLRARATLLGLAMGDALGMPAQTLTRAEIRARYGRITGFVAPFAGHPVSHGLRAAQVTDDTEQTLLLARRLIADPVGFDEAGWARDLLDWEAGIRAKGLQDLLGPSSRAAIEALLAGASPEVTGARGTTNGAAMRIAPIGIMTPPETAALVARVARTCRVTHNTGEAIAAAAAVAMTVSCGLAGADLDAALDPALAACRAGQAQGNAVGEPDMAGRIALAQRRKAARTAVLRDWVTATRPAEPMRWRDPEPQRNRYT